MLWEQMEKKVCVGLGEPMPKNTGKSITYISKFNVSLPYGVVEATVGRPHIMKGRLLHCYVIKPTIESFWS